MRNSFYNDHNLIRDLAGGTIEELALDVEFSHDGIEFPSLDREDSRAAFARVCTLEIRVVYRTIRAAKMTDHIVPIDTILRLLSSGLLRSIHIFYHAPFHPLRRLLDTPSSAEGLASFHDTIRYLAPTSLTITMNMNKRRGSALVEPLSRSFLSLYSEHPSPEVVFRKGM